jgi:hypothetical protein
MANFFRVSVAVTSLVIAVVVGGCGGSSEADEVRSTMRSFEEAVATGDGETACSYVTGESGRRWAEAVEEPDCVAAFTDTDRGEDEIAAAVAEVEKYDHTVEIDGSEAIVRIEGESGRTDLVKVEGKWYIVLPPIG